MVGEVPEYVRQLTSINTTPVVSMDRSGAAVAGQVSDVFAQYSANMKKKADEAMRLELTANMREEMARMGRQYQNDPATLQKSLDSFRTGFIGDIQDADIAREFDARFRMESIGYIDSATNGYNRMVSEQRQLGLMRNVQINQSRIDQLSKMSREGPPEFRANAVAEIEKLVGENISLSSMTNPDTGELLLTPNQIMAVATDTTSNLVKSLPFDKQLNALNFDGSMDQLNAIIRKHEGGMAMGTEPRGFSAAFGINEEANKEAYKQVKAIFETEGAAAAQAAADAYLKKEYYDKYNLDEVQDPLARAIAYDGSINHGSTFRSKLIGAAKQGASPAELLAMRYNEYERLNKSGKYSQNDYKSWMGRLETFNDLMPSQYVSLLPVEVKDRIVSDAKKQLAELQKVEDGVQAIDSGRAPYMASKDRQAATDEHYKRFLSDMAGSGTLNEQSLLEGSVAYVQQYNTIPTEVKNTVNGMINSQDSGQVTLAADMIVKIADSNPNVAGDLSQETVNKAFLVKGLVEQGIPYEQVAERMRERQLADPDVVASYAKIYDEYAKNRPDRDYIASDEGGFFTSEPEVPTEMLVDFDRRVKDVMPYFQEPELARKAALASLRRAWGVSYIDGEKQYIKGAPEQRFGAPGLTPEENSEWMRGQIISQFQKQYLVSDVDKDYMIKLAPSRTNANYYNVNIISDDGIISPILWKPDWQSSQMAKDKAKKLEESIRRARKKREGNMDDIEFGRQIFNTTEAKTGIIQ